MKWLNVLSLSIPEVAEENKCRLQFFWSWLRWWLGPKRACGPQMSRPRERVMSRRDPLWRRSRSRDHQFRLFFIMVSWSVRRKLLRILLQCRLSCPTGSLLSKSTSAASSVPLTVGGRWIGKTTSGSGLRTNLR